jgi:hypothetical protein
MDKYYVVLKLITGEQLMATFISEDEYTVNITNVLSVKSIVISESDRKYESMTVSPFCQFTDDPDFVLDKSLVIYVKELSDDVAEKYKSLIESEFELKQTQEYESDKETDLPSIYVNGSDKLQ